MKRKTLGKIQIILGIIVLVLGIIGLISIGIFYLKGIDNITNAGWYSEETIPLLIFSISGMAVTSSLFSIFGIIVSLILITEGIDKLLIK